MGLLEKPYDLIIEEDIPDEYSPYKAESGYGWAEALPQKQGLYDPELEKDACGVGFTAYVPFGLS